MLLYLFSEASSLKTELRNVFSATSWSYRPLGLPIVGFMAEISIKTQKCYVNEQILKDYVKDSSEWSFKNAFS